MSPAPPATARTAPGSRAPCVGFDVQVPDLRDCTFATAEPTPDWLAVVHEGGPVRGLDRMMPAYGGALSDEEIARVVDYARGFCRQLPGLAARRPEPAARAVHREGVP